MPLKIAPFSSQPASDDQSTPTSGNTAGVRPARAADKKQPSGILAGLELRRSTGKLSEADSVRPPFPDREVVLAMFGTASQRIASDAEQMDSADDAALQEGIARSLQEKAFDILVSSDFRPVQNSPRVPDCGTSVENNQPPREGQPSEVSEANRAVQMLGFANLNKAFLAHLDKHDLNVIPNSGKENNCAIFALVQHVRPNLTSTELDDEVSELRELYNTECPQDADKMLHLDTREGGAADILIRLVNKHYGVNVQVGVVEAGVEEAYPVTSGEPISASGASAPFTHRLVIWDRQGHYEAVAAKPEMQSETKSAG